MAKQYTMKQRISFNEGLAKAGGEKGARAKGYLQAVKDMNTAKRINRARAEKAAAKAAAEANGGKKK